MSEKENPEEFYSRLKVKLEEVENFPTEYTYKFIITSSLKKLAEIQQIFDRLNPQYQTKASKNGKYTSITVVIYAIDADQIIHYYKEVSKIEGVMML